MWTLQSKSKTGLPLPIIIFPQLVLTSADEKITEVMMNSTQNFTWAKVETSLGDTTSNNRSVSRNYSHMKVLCHWGGKQRRQNLKEIHFIYIRHMMLENVFKKDHTPLHISAPKGTKRKGKHSCLSYLFDAD